MEFYAFHGCMAHEKSIGTKYLVSIAMYFDASAAAASDDLHDTVNYQTVYDLVKIEMNKPSNLIENVARRIADTLQKNIPLVEKWDVKLSKINPPLGGNVACATIEISV